MSHANATLTPAGRLRLARLSSTRAGRWPGRPNGSRSASPPPVAGPTATASSARPGWSTGPRGRIAARPAAPANRAADPGAAGHPPVGTGPDRLPPGPEPLDGPQGPPPLPLPAAEVDRPGHRHPDQVGPRQAPLRARRARRPGPRRHQEARPDPRRRRLAHPRPGSAQDNGGVARTARPAPVHRLARLRLPPPRRRRPLPAGLLRDPHRRAQGDRRGVLDARQRLLRRPRHHRQGGADRQRLLLPLEAVGQDPRQRSSTAAPVPTGPRPTARSNGSTAPCSRNGPTPAPTAQKPNAPPPTRPGSTLQSPPRPHRLKGKSPIDLVPNVPGQNI